MGEEKYSDCVQQFKISTVKSMWSLKKQYLSKNIFIWLENRIDSYLFTSLSFMGIEINGFCSSNSTEMTNFLKKPVVHPGLIMQRLDTIILFCDKNRKERIEWEYPDRKAKICFKEELLEMREELWEKNAVIIYDSLREARKVIKLLQDSQIEIMGTCAIGGKSFGNVLGENILEEDELIRNCGIYNIILASSNEYYEKSINHLLNKNIDIFLPSKDIFYTSFNVIQIGCMEINLDNALRKGKKIVLYGTETCFTNAWMSFLHATGIKIDKIVDEYDNGHEGIYSIYDLAYENPMETYVIINRKISCWIESCELLESLGFTDFNKMYTGLYAVSYRHLPYTNDVTLGHVTNELLKNTKHEGFRVYGMERKESYKIVILGGSTTTAEAFRVPCWPRLLYERLYKENQNMIMYNGGVDGYTAADELYKLIRDVSCLKPDLIISFSGVNNRRPSQYPRVSGHLIDIFEEISSNGFCKGLREEIMSAAQVWVQMEHMMREISENVYHAKFICFLQPIYISKAVLTLRERLQFSDTVYNRNFSLAFRREVSELVQKYEWIVDLQDFLDEYPDVFFDSMHVYEKGNQMIADRVYAYMEEERLIGR